MRLFSLFWLISLSSCEYGSSKTVPTPTDDCELTSFYNIPVTLRFEKIGQLGLPYALGRQMSEGITLRTATFPVRKSVNVTVVFDRHGKLIEMTTSSPAASACKGIGIGSTLKEVQNAWPNGRLYYGEGEIGTYATFFTGTNLGYRMSNGRQVDRNGERKVVQIVIKPYKLKL